MLVLEKYLAGAEALVKAGCDAITVADNPLANLRVSNLAMGAKLRERGIIPLLHLSCRDQNVLGLQSSLLGMAALGIRHVLPLTGDPIKVGDHPRARPVCEVRGGVELISIIKRLNEGFSQAGNPIKMQTSFVIGCTFNPNAENLDVQVARLERKVEAGAQFAMTQPVFDVRRIEEMVRRTAHVRIPILTGVWPLVSGRQAEFLNDKVTGIVVPDSVRAEMAGLEGAAGRACGIKLAKEIARAALGCCPGVYLITPSLQYESTVELAEFARGI
jgi:homocysteine S-methyltransferase